MFKFILGAAAVVALVGYGVITTDDIERAGSTVVEGINTAATYVKDSTETSSVDSALDSVREAIK